MPPTNKIKNVNLHLPPLVLDTIYDFYEQQGLAINYRQFQYTLGKLIFSEGEIYTLEEADKQESFRYKLVPFAFLNKNDIFTEPSTELERITAFETNLHPVTAQQLEKISTVNGNDLEYIALNTYNFPLFKN